MKTREDIAGSSGNGLPRRVMILLIALAAYAPMKAQAGTITQHDPVQNTTEARLNLIMVNNNAGTLYDSARLNIHDMLGGVADAIIAKNSDYTNKTRSEVMAGWAYTIQSPPSGEVYSGWESLLESDSKLSISHAEGDPDSDYITWKSTQADPSRDMMAVSIFIPGQQLDFNHDNELQTNETVQRGTNTIADALVARSAAGYDYSSSAKDYSLMPIPEPGAIASIAIGGAALSNSLSLTIAHPMSTTSVIEMSHSLASASWTNLGVILPSATNWLCAIPSNSPPALFFRLRRP